MTEDMSEWTYEGGRYPIHVPQGDVLKWGRPRLHRSIEVVAVRPRVDALPVFLKDEVEGLIKEFKDKVMSQFPQSD